MKRFRRGGVHPPEMKLTSGEAIIDIDMPRMVTLQLDQSLGRPAKAVAAKGEHVNRGQCIGQAQGPISANVHTPISGTVKAVGEVIGLDGKYHPGVTIEADDADHFADLQAISDARPTRSVEEVLKLTSDNIIAEIREAGIVGLGGATFPTATKLAPSPAGKAEILLINGAECEPYLTCDEAIMLELTDEIIDGIAILMAALNVGRAIVGIENNKQKAIGKMRQSARRYPGIEVEAMATCYPQGAEKMLTDALTQRQIAPGKLPVSEGVVIQNVATALAVYHALCWGLPLIERVITISGKHFSRRGNYRIPIGVSLSDIVNGLGGVPKSTVEIVAGGTMMGRSAAGIMGNTTKGLSGLLFLSADECASREPGPCVKCGRCIEVCPMGLEPNLIARLSELSRWDEAAQHHIMDCMECGCCSYQCIAQRRLLDWIKVGKANLRNKK